MQAYQQASSGTQEKHNADYDTVPTVDIPVSGCKVTLTKTAPERDVLTGGSLTYYITYTNIATATVGAPPNATLAIVDQIPTNAKLLLPSTPVCTNGTVYYSTNGTTWTKTQPASNSPKVTAVKCVLGGSLPAGNSGLFQYTVVADDSSGVYSAPAASNFTAGALCSNSLSVTTTPVTLSYFRASKNGNKVRFERQTGTETNNAGFNLFEVVKGKNKKLNKEMIRSAVINSILPQDYSFEAAGVTGTQFYLQEVDTTGDTRLHGPFALGTENGTRVSFELIDWAAIRAEHNNSNGRSRGKQLDSALTSDPAAARLSASSTLSVITLRIDQDGLYRLTCEALKAAGFDLAGTASADLALLNRGQPVPLFVSSSGAFGTGAYIEFVGQALDTLYTRTNVYELTVNRAKALRVATDTRSPSLALTPVPYYMETITVNDNRVYYQGSPVEDPWYNAQLYGYPAAVEKTFAIDAEGLVPGAAPAALSVRLWGESAHDPNPDHHLVISFNGSVVADEYFDGITAHTASVTLGASTVMPAGNLLKLRVPLDNGVPWDIQDVDRFSLNYPRAFVARGGRLTFTAAGSLFKVTGLTSGSVVVYRQSGSTLTRLSKVTVKAEGGAYSATFAGLSTPATYLVASVGALPVPVVAAGPSNTDITSGQAQYVMIAHPDFVAGLQPLVAARRAQGYTVRVVNVEDIYAQFGYRIFDPAAIKPYIKYAAQNMGTQYVLLVGGDTYDYQNYLGVGSMSFIPSLYAQTNEYVYYAPVDPLFADVNGDNAPDLAIGRFPVRTSAELDLLVSKTLAYGSKDYAGTAVFAADSGFGADSNSFIAQLPSGWSVSRAHIDELGKDAARTRLLSALNSGVAYASFVGHSGPTTWTFSGLFRATDAAALTNYGRPIVVTQWGCWNTYHVVPQYNTLAHKFLLSGNQGAAAVLGATGLSMDSSERIFGQLLTPRLTQPGNTVGAAVQAAKAELGSNANYVDVVLGWTLLGDPTLVVQP